MPGLPTPGFPRSGSSEDSTDDPSEEPEEGYEVVDRVLWGILGGLQRRLALYVGEGLGVEAVLALIAYA
jgi:hypothetical protein